MERSPKDEGEVQGRGEGKGMKKNSEAPAPLKDCGHYGLETCINNKLKSELYDS